MLNSQLYNLTASTSLPLVIAGVGAFVVIIYFFYSIFSIKLIKKRNEKYIDRFESVYEEKKVNSYYIRIIRINVFKKINGV